MSSISGSTPMLASACFICSIRRVDTTLCHDLTGAFFALYDALGDAADFFRRCDRRSTKLNNYTLHAVPPQVTLADIRNASIMRNCGAGVYAVFVKLVFFRSKQPHA
jgi:hypothetical protein